MMSWLTLLVTSPALAGVPVIHDGGGPELLEQVASRTGLPTSQLDSVSLSTLLEEPPQALGAALRHCAGTPNRSADVRADLVRAEAAWAEGERRKAMDHLDLAMAHIGCLEELAEPAVVARVFLLRGSMIAAADQLPEAVVELRSALAFSPELTWDPDFPAEGEGALIEARVVENPVALDVAPAGTGSGPWVNGAAVKTTARSVSPGLHLVQSPASPGIRSAWLVVKGDATLVIPASYRRPVLERMADPAQRSEVELLLLASFPDLPAVYVASEGGVWLVTLSPEGASTTELVSASAEEEAVEDDSRRRRKRRR